MRIDELINTLKEQNFPKGEYAVFGSAVMAVRGIREAPNIDLIATNKLWQELIEKQFQPDDEGFIRIGQLKISNWWFVATRKDIPTMIQEAEIIQEIPFVRLEEVKDYKKFLNRDKDKNDVKLIDQFLSSTLQGEPTGLGIDTYEKILTIFKSTVDELLGGKVLSLVVFGSVSKIKATGSSDVDIFVLFDDSEVNRNELMEVLVSIILNLRKTTEYMKLTDRGIYPEVYPFLISKSHINDYLWVFFDATLEGIIIKDTENFAKKLLEEIKTKLNHLGGKRVQLPNGKSCWILYNNFVQVLNNQINL